MKDDEIQELMDNGTTVPDSEAAREYRELFALLDEKQQELLSPGFAHRVTSSIEARKANDPIKKWIFLLSLVFLAVIATLIALMSNSGISRKRPVSWRWICPMSRLLRIWRSGRTRRSATAPCMIWWGRSART